MNANGSRNRRDVVATIAGGAVLGGLWGAAFPIVATERRPTIAVVGHRRAQIVLIDSTSARAMVLSGEPDDGLMDALPAMMTVFRQRIDVLIATPAVLAQRARSLERRWRIRHAIAMAGTLTTAPLGIPTTVVDGTLGVTLDGDMALEIRMGHRNAWRADAADPGPELWCVGIRTRAGNVVIAPDISSVTAIGLEASALMIVPDAPTAEMLALSPASAVAVNHDSETIDPPPTSGPALTRIYPQDVARFVITDRELELPEWSQLFPDDG